MIFKKRIIKKGREYFKKRSGKNFKDFFDFEKTKNDLISKTYELNDDHI